MSTKLILVFVLQITAFAEEKPFLDFRKVIRGALDVIAAVPSTSSVNHSEDNLEVRNSIHKIVSVDAEMFNDSDIFQQFAAQTDFISHQSMQPLYSRFWMDTSPRAANIDPDYNAAFVQALFTKLTSHISGFRNGLDHIDCSLALPSKGFANQGVREQNLLPKMDQQPSIQTEQQAQIFQPIIRSGDLYYQPTGVSSETLQPKIISYRGQLYMMVSNQDKIQSEIQDKNESMEVKNKNHQMRKILTLRRKMAADRKKFADRKRLLSSMKRRVHKEMVS
ncbi:unnamed protein product [Thelazia callipaeda]|uniref:BZIP domain-containing protein n=1 Tax=Thelazia callipaeda TaxID=103827 RepID=A0A0N5D7Q3_THECL|nr:unnamed protein product [Thelazia callipaeda]